MFHVLRGAAPAALESRAVAEEFARLPPERRKLRDAPRWPDGESPITSLDAGTRDAFRPTAGVAEASGAFLPDHHWAQTFTWANRYWACASCSRAKGKRFPLEPGTPRAAPDADREALKAEQALLLDPCADQPEEHLLFSLDGRVSGLTGRGRATIEILDLNRSVLVAEHHTQARTFVSLYEACDAKKKAAVQKQIRSVSDTPYLALKRQLLHDAADAPAARKRERQAKLRRPAGLVRRPRPARQRRPLRPARRHRAHDAELALGQPPQHPTAQLPGAGGGTAAQPRLAGHRLGRRAASRQRPPPQRGRAGVGARQAPWRAPSEPR
jgi:hypothetical protein